MGDFYNVLDWASGLLVAAAIGVITLTHKELRAARVALMIGAWIAIVRWVMWSFTTDAPWLMRAAIGAVIGAIILGGLPPLWRLAIERAKTEGPQTGVATAPPQQRRFIAAEDRERLLPLCTELIGFLRDNGGDGGGRGAWHALATLGNDWLLIGARSKPDFALLHSDLAKATTAVKSLWNGLYGPDGIFRQNESYHRELESFFPPGEDYPGQILGLEPAIGELGSAIAAVETQKDPTERRKVFAALQPTREKYLATIQAFQRHLFEATQRVEQFKSSLEEPP